MHRKTANHASRQQRGVALFVVITALGMVFYEAVRALERLALRRYRKG